MRRSSDRRSKRIGIFGGTFDPPHIGHLVIAENARVQLMLDLVVFIPAFLPPHKSYRSGTTPHQRLTMTRRAISGMKRYTVSDIEVKRKGLSYTVDTLREFRRRYPSAMLFLILGEDNLADFRNWKQPRIISRLARLAFYRRGRGGIPKRRLRNVQPRIIKGPLLEISSTEIRRRINSNLPIRFLVPPKVEKYIARHRLYRAS